VFVVVVHFVMTQSGNFWIYRPISSSMKHISFHTTDMTF